MKDHPVKIISITFAQPLHEAVFKGELNKVSNLLKQGADWRVAGGSPASKTEISAGKSIFTPNMNALEIAVVRHHAHITALILQYATLGKDDSLVQRACNVASGFKFATVLKAFHSNQNIVFTVEDERFLQQIDLDERLTQSSSWLDTFKLYTEVVAFKVNGARNYLSDKWHERALHNQKIQEKAISRYGQKALIAGRSFSLLTATSPVHFGLSLAWNFIGQSYLRENIYKAVGEFGAYAAPKFNFSAESGRQYLPYVFDNTITLCLMPEYYLTSTVLSSAVYYGFKDRGYDNAEAAVQLIVDGVAYSATEARGTASTVDERRCHQLNNSISTTPVIGEYIAPWLTPVLAGFESISNQANALVNYPLDALAPYYSASFLSNLSQYLPSPIKAGIDGVRALQQKKGLLEQRVFNRFEQATFSLMNDSVGKQNRLHAIQLFETQRLYAELNDLEKRLEEAKATADNSRIISKTQTAIASQKQLLNTAIELEQSLFEKTEGFAHFEKWQTKYQECKFAEVDKSVSQDKKRVMNEELVRLKEKSDFYNNDSIRLSGEAWAKWMDELHTKHQGNILDSTNIVGSIENIISKACAHSSDRNVIAKISADEIIRYRFPFYPSIGDKSQIESERQSLINEISTDELAGFNSNPHRAKRRLYDYVFAKISNTAKKQHVPRHQRILKPFVNEILGKTIGYIPYKDFKGGRTGNGGLGLEANKSSGQQFQAVVTVAGESVYNLRSGAKRGSIEFTLPKPEVKAPTVQGAKQAASQSTMPGTTRIDLDSPYMQDILATQYKQTLVAKVESVGKRPPAKVPAKETAEKLPTKAFDKPSKQSTADQRQKSVKELLTKPWAKRRKSSSIPELEGPLLTREQSAGKKPPIRSTNAEPSLGKKLLSYVLKDAEGSTALRGAAISNPNEINVAGADRSFTDVDKKAIGTLADDANTIRETLVAGMEVLENIDLTLPPKVLVAEALLPYFGTDPTKRATEVDSTTFPAVSSLNHKIEGRSAQPVSGLHSYTFPLKLAGLLLYNYRTNKDPEGWSKKGRLKAQSLPNEGRIRYIPPKDYIPSRPLPRGPNNGFYDDFRNEWVKGPSRTPGEPFEWDIQLSELGKKQLGWASRDQKHLNVSLKGKITHR